MGILDLRNITNLADFYHRYQDYVKSQFEEKKANSIIAKTNTSLVRYVLPEYGFLLKLDGNLSPAEMLEGLKFMEQVPISQVVHLLETQERVFNRFGERVSPAIRRAYRSTTKIMLDWGKLQDWWKQSVETSSHGRTPTMLIFKKRVEHWHKLKPEELSPSLSQQLSHFSLYCTTLRQPCLSEGSCVRYHREILGVLGWMHRIKGIAVANLSLADLVPVAAVYDQGAAERVATLAQEYLDWMRANLGGKEATLKFALQAFFYLAEYIQDEYTKNA
ncbi:hypothetical protein H6F51_01090 [Cyanobacteria bacterium FACHB-DQ100]|nr:hypothetical protein [Cyanobacteria bacterium FACHB-DQ100]